MSKLIDTLILIDGDVQAEKFENAIVAHWSSFNSGNNVFSIPVLVDEQGEALRKDYLDWIHDLSKQFGDEEDLKLKNDFSLWWSGLLQEKSIYKSPEIYDIFRLRVLEKLYTQYQCKKIILFTDNKRLHKMIDYFVKKLKGELVYSSVKPARKWKLSRKVLPYPLRAFLYYARACWQRRLFTRSNNVMSKVDPASKKKNITFISYFPNIDKKKATRGEFYSRYWEGLHNLIDQLDVSITWAFIYVPNTDYSQKEAIALIQHFNERYKGKQHFLFLDELLTLRSWLKILAHYTQRLFKTVRLRNAITYFSPSDTLLPFQFIWKDAWRSSIYGPVAMDAHIWMERFNALASTLEKQDQTIYLMEGQAWERILTYVWRQHGHGKLYGFSHSVIRFFDLRYYESSCFWDAIKQEVSAARYFPDKVITTGLGQERELSASGFPQDYLIKAEAIRYTYLNHVERGRDFNKVLLCATDYAFEATINQLTLLDQAIKTYPSTFENMTILIKPHPYLPLDQILNRFSFESLVEIVHAPLSELWSKGSIFFSSNGTTASLEAAILGIPCVIAQDPKAFNFNPLRKYTDIPFVSTGGELAKAIQSTTVPKSFAEYFTLDSSLPAWKEIL